MIKLAQLGTGRVGAIHARNAAAKVLLTTALGRLCMISNSRRSGYGYDQRIEAFGAKGLVRADNVMESTVSVWGAAGAASDSFQNFFLDR